MNLILRHVASAALCCAALLAPLAASAVPAYPGLIKMTQPDGSEINVQLRGDEHHHFTLSEDGFLLTQNNGAYYYADVDNQGNVVASAFMAKPMNKRSQAERNFLSNVDMNKVFDILTDQRNAVMEVKSAVSRAMSPARVAPLATNDKGYGLFAGATYPVIGKQKGLVILVEYADVKFNDSYDAHDYFQRMLNEKDFSTNGGTGSARDFFLEVSDGQFDIEFDLYGPVTLPKNRSYYGKNDAYGDANAWEMTVDACKLLEDEVDFTQYDRDGDGRIDNVFVFYAGLGEATGGPEDSVWPHAFYVTTKGTHKVDGVIIDRYACTNEWEIAYKTPRADGVGTFIHEFSHVMGLPDLYSTAYNSNSFTPGRWSCLDMGPYNNDGRTPPLYGMFERNALGWVKPTPITDAMNGRLESIGSHQGYIINTTRPQEFFLLENRQQVSWDRYIPGNGMLIWHVLYNASIWTSNSVNNTPSIQYVDIEEADGTQTEATRAFDAFPGPSGRYTEFTDATTPNMLTWQKKSLGLPITDIAMDNGVITFKVKGGRPVVNPTVALESKDITPGGFTAVWKGVEGDMKYALSVYTKNDNDKPVYVSGLYKHIVEGTSFSTSDLEPSTTYYWTVAVYDSANKEYSDESNELSFTTGEATLEYMRPELKETTNVTEESFTVNWEAFEGATNYLVNVFTRKPVDLATDTCGFDDFVRPTYYLPSGWSSNVSENYTNAKYAGESAPSIKMTVDGQYIQSPVYKGANTVRSIKFWHRGVTANDENTIRVEALVGEDWIEVADLPISYATTGETCAVASFPELAQSVRLVFNRKVTGSLAIDDIVVSYASSDEDIALPEYTDREVAAPTTSLSVTGLAPNAYYYTVTAEVGDVRTRPSFAGHVSLLFYDASIDNISADAALAGVTVDGNRLTVAEAATVYDLQGRVVAEMKAGTAKTFPTGVYMVRIAGVTAKVALR